MFAGRRLAGRGADGNEYIHSIYSAAFPAVRSIGYGRRWAAAQREKGLCRTERQPDASIWERGVDGGKGGLAALFRECPHRGRTESVRGKGASHHGMNGKQRNALALRETDVQGAVRRFCGNEQLYAACLLQFLDDPTVAQLNEAIAAKSWDDAFTAAHALKGLAGNLGFVPLMHSTGHLVILIRGGRTREVGEYITQVNSNYRDITDAIGRIFN